MIIVTYCIVNRLFPDNNRKQNFYYFRYGKLFKYEYPVVLLFFVTFIYICGKSYAVNYFIYFYYNINLIDNYKIGKFNN